MRYYDIIVTEPKTGALVQRYTNYVNGRIDLGGLDVEFDIAVDAPLALPTQGSSFVRVWGIPLITIAQQTALNGKNVAVYGGMQKGLPLANPRQAGLLTQGMLYPTYGNWQGTAMTLDMQIVPYLFAGLGEAVNIVLNWPRGQPLETALQNALRVAFPAAQIKISISPNLVQNYDEPGFYGNLQQLAQWVQQKTQAILGGTYPGVDIAMNGATITVTDGTVPSKPKQIDFQDLIGQPTWLSLSTMQVQTVQRADIGFNDMVTLPTTPTSLTAAAVAPPPAGNLSRSNSAFRGSFRVIRARHVGRLRQPDAGSWSSIFDLLLTPPPTEPVNVGPAISSPVGTI